MHRSLSVSLFRFHIGVLVPLHVAVVVKSRAESRGAVARVLQNGALDKLFVRMFRWQDIGLRKYMVGTCKIRLKYFALCSLQSAMRIGD